MKALSPARLVDRALHGPDLATLHVAVDGGVPKFLPGQFVALGFLDDGRATVRPYSIASAPGGDAYELYVRRVEGGAVTPRLFAAPIGSELVVGRPKGRFIEPTGGRLVLIATGTGIAPFVSITRAHAQADDPRPIVILHGARHVGDLTYDAWLRAQIGAGRPWRYLPVVSRPDGSGWAGRTGYVQQHLAEIGPTHDDVFMICGARVMVDDVAERLRTMGVDPAKIHTEAWG